MNIRRRDRLPIMLAVIVIYSCHGRADTWQNTVSATVSAEYDTNPTRSPTNPQSVWRTLLEPGYALTGILGENELRTGLGLQISRSSNETLSPMRNSPSIFLEWLHHIDAGELGIASRYAEIATRDAGIDATGQVPVASTRASRSISGRWSKALGLRSTLAADGGYEGVSYTGSTFVDYSTRSANLMFSYAASERSTPFIKASYADYEPTDGGPIIRITSGVLGLNLKLSDYVTGSIQAGRYKYRDSTEEGKIGGAALQYTGEQMQLTVNAGRQIAPSGLGGFVTVDQANGNWSYALSELSSAGIDLGWRRSNFVSTLSNQTVGVWLVRELNPFWGMRTYYLHNVFSGDVIDTASSNILGLTLSYPLPISKTNVTPTPWLPNTN